MKGKWLVALVFAFVLGWSMAWADDPPQFPQNATFSTLITTPRVIEGLTGDNAGNLYAAGVAIAGDTSCPVWRVNLTIPSLVVVGNISTPCFPLGLAFNDVGDLYIANAAAGKIVRLTPNSVTPPTATDFTAGGSVPGANGIAFDRNGNLWVSDGTTGRGRVWKIAPCGAPPCPVTEVFRIQPMANEVNLVLGVGGVGRDVRDLPPGTITVTTTTRNATNTAGSQPLVANGLAFNDSGDLFVSDTARGALWKVEFDRHGNLKSQTGCDTTFTANTLCLDNVFVAHPILEGADGIALDRAGNVWVDANERNAVAVVTKDGRVSEVFRNPVNTNTNLRNAATNPADNDRILEFPTSPVLSGNTFCTANADLDRRDNSPNTAGEVTPAGPNRAKISCMDQELNIRGLPLPIR